MTAVPLVALMMLMLAVVGYPSQLPASAQTTPPTSLTDHELQVTLDGINPTIVTSGSAQTLTVSGTVTNNTSSPVSAVNIRMQRAAPVKSQNELRTTDTLSEANYQIFTPNSRIADTLDAGETTAFSVSFPFRGGTGDSLHFRESGVFPILVNATATTSTGFNVQDLSARFLLPVLDLPALPDSEPTDDEGDDAPEATERQPVPLTLVWPLVDKPRVAPGSTGDAQVLRLLDDDLAESLSAGGRLDQALTAVERAIAPEIPGSQLLASALCLAIDPDLVLTVRGMQSGYQVVLDPDDPTGPTTVGTGSVIAGVWLDRLRTLAEQLCTVATPSAQVDLEALARIQQPAIAHRALVASTEALSTILGTTTLGGIALPDSAVISNQSASMIADTPLRTALIASNNAATDSSEPYRERFANISIDDARSADRTLPVMLFDATVGELIAAAGEQPIPVNYASATPNGDVTKDRVARSQDAVGALSWAALAPRSDSDEPLSDAPSSIVISPPPHWDVTSVEGVQLFTAATQLLESGKARPEPLAALITEATRSDRDRPSGILQYPQSHEDVRVPEALLERAGRASLEVEEFRTALADDPSIALTPDAFLAPLRNDIIRALSMSGRVSPIGTSNEAQDEPDRMGRKRIKSVENSVAFLHEQVTVLNPGGVHTLASAQSPLLLVARNNLPIPVRVRLQVDAPVGVFFEDIGVQQLPPRGSRQLSIPTEVSYNRQFAVDLQLTTPDNHVLGEAIRISVRSTAYGRIMTILTATAGFILLLLAGRRLWHRFRGQPDPADEGHEPT
ncbi:hypothetical protein GCM10011410_15610 [Hoyosella rhizosphaerae]|uniref:Glycoprotein n=2 Tax=Hoyosella rhizosphaerae TaxID=1755582 RepID=A0A916XDN3_9ACTN|nr:hypothetical protein GCM10011410_15610 [Hoyosella rhizosphaerae]